MNFYRFINKIIVLFLSFLLLEGCDSWCNSSQKEELLVVLPAWPPDNSGNKSKSQYPDYPKLIKWEICLCNSYEETIFYSVLKKSHLQYHFQNNNFLIFL